MISMKTFCAALLVASSFVLAACRSYNNGLIFYNLENGNTYLPPTISVSRGRGLAKFKYSPRGSIWSTFGRPCNCRGPLCGCCVGIKVKQYNFDQKLCANVSYAAPKDEIQLEVVFNDTATAKYGMAARNPSPLCVPIMMGIPMSMCIQMSNIGVQGDNLNMCMDFLVRLASTELFEMHFQCMKVGLQGASWVGADGQPVIPANEGKIKIKFPNVNDSDEYYDAGETDQENEIISKESDDKRKEGSVQEEDLNKAEEETDYNDITEKIIDIVKNQEKDTLKENKIEGFAPLHENTQEIVQNIMDSINEANAAEIEEDIENEEHPLSMESEGIKTASEEQDFSNDIRPDELNVEKNEINNSADLAPEENQTDEDYSKKPDIELEETYYQEVTTEKASEDLETATIEKFEMLINTDEAVITTETSSGINEPNNNVELHQQIMETSTEQLMTTIAEDTAHDNDSTGAAVMSTTTKPTKLYDYSAVAIAFSGNTPDIDNDKTGHDYDEGDSDDDDDDDDDEDGDDSEEERDEEKEESDSDDGNSHENDSDYDEEESEEFKDETIEKGIESNRDTAIMMPAANDLNKAFAATLELANDFDASEKITKNTYNTFEVRNGDEFLENSGVDNQHEFDKQHTDTAAKEYDEHYEDYETQTPAIKDKKTTNDKKIYYTSTISSVFNNSSPVTTIHMFDGNNLKAEIPQIASASSNNLQFISSRNTMTSKTNAGDVLNVVPSSNKITHNIAKSTATTTGTVSSNAMPLPLARKLFSLYHQQKQQQKQQSYRHYKQKHQHYV